ncbi:MAG: SpoIIE family protein phosphatase [Acidobacteriota bacterium]
MKIRTQLALSFLLFTIVPLAGLTLYSYSTSIRAFRNVVQEESAGLAKEMSHRMEAVTRDLQQRIHRLDRRPFYQLRAEGKGKDQVHPAEVYAQILSHMGDMASYVDSLEIPAPPSVPPAADHPRGAFASPSPPRIHSPRASASDPGALAMVKPGSDARNPDFPLGGLPSKADVESVVVYMNNLPDVMRSGEAGALAMKVEQQKNRIVLSCPDTQAQGLTAGGEAPDKQATVYLSEAQIKKIQAEAAKAAEEAVKNAEQMKRLGAAMQRQRRNEAARWQRKAERIRATMELMVAQQNGNSENQQGPAPIKAQIRADEILSRIFERGRFAHGEIQFAVDKAGNVHSPDPPQAARVEKLGLKTATGKPATVESCPDDWIFATAFEPVSGMTFGIARPIGGSLQQIRATALRNLGVGLGFIALAFLGIVPLSGRMTRSLSALTQGVERLSRGDLETRVPVRSKNEFGALAAAFNQMAADLAQQQKRLVEQERLQKELEMCRRIQEVLLPREPLKVGFAEARGISIPARQVGGDFFNYFVLPEGDVAVLMGDVSGKGVPAALLMANLQARLQARLQVERNLARLAEEIDVEISRQTEPQTFATLFMGIISREGRVLRWVNAGHNPQYVLGVDGRLQVLSATGKPVGLLPGDSFEEHQTSLQPGDFLFLYTDGLVEAENPQAEEFGTPRLEAILMKEREFNPDQIVADIVQAVTEHRAGTDAGDDATLLALKVA